MKINIFFNQIIFLILICSIAFSDEKYIQNSQLHDVHYDFLFYENNNFYSTIPNHGIEAFKIIVDKLDITELLKKYNDGPAYMPIEIETEALELLEKTNSKIISAMLPEYSDLKIDFLQTGLVLQPSGDGGYWGFLRKLEILPLENMEDTHQIIDNLSNSLRPVGICWDKSDEQRFKLSKIDAEKLSANKSGECISKIINGIDNIKCIAEYSLDNILKLYIGEFEKEDGTTQLFSFIFNTKYFTQLSFELTETISEEFLEIESNEFANDVSLHDTSYWLMTIEETKIPILFIKSTVSIIFILHFEDNISRWNSNSFYYRGP